MTNLLETLAWLLPMMVLLSRHQVRLVLARARVKRVTERTAGFVVVHSAYRRPLPYRRPVTHVRSRSGDRIFMMGLALAVLFIALCLPYFLHLVAAVPQVLDSYQHSIVTS